MNWAIDTTEDLYHKHTQCGCIMEKKGKCMQQVVLCNKRVTSSKHLQTRYKIVCSWNLKKVTWSLKEKHQPFNAMLSFLCFVSLSLTYSKSNHISQHHNNVCVPRMIVINKGFFLLALKQPESLVVPSDTFDRHGPLLEHELKWGG